MSLDEASTNDSTVIDGDLVASLGFEPTTTIEPIGDDVIDVRDAVETLEIPEPGETHTVGDPTADAVEETILDGSLSASAVPAVNLTSNDVAVVEDRETDLDDIVDTDTEVDLTSESTSADVLDTDADVTDTDADVFDTDVDVLDTDVDVTDTVATETGNTETETSAETIDADDLADEAAVVVEDQAATEDSATEDLAPEDVVVEDAADSDLTDGIVADSNDNVLADDDEPLFGSTDSELLSLTEDAGEGTGEVELFDIGGDDDLGDSSTSVSDDTGSELEVPLGLDLLDAPPLVVDPSSLATPEEVFAPVPETGEPTTIGDPVDDVAVGDITIGHISLGDSPADAPAIPEPVLAAAAAPVARTGTATAVTPAPSSKRQKLRARKVRRVIRHVDPWSVLTFSVLFHLVFFSSLLLASILVWNGAVQAGTIDNIENFVRELGDYETFNINSDVVFRAAVVIAGMLTLASSIIVVLLSVVFNLVSDLVGGIRITVVEEDTVVVPPTE